MSATLHPAAPSDADKAAIWQAYHQGTPRRVPLRLNTNPRVIHFNPEWNPDGITFEQAATDPRAHVEIALRHQLYQRVVLNHYTDSPTSLPATWEIGLHLQNVAEAACLGAPVRYPAGQVPTNVECLDEAHKHDIFAVDIEHPLSGAYCQANLRFWQAMVDYCRDLKFLGRPVRVGPWAIGGTDGPVTIACNLRGTDFLLDLADDPEYADRLLTFLTRAAIVRRQAFWDHWGDRMGHWNGMADDACAMLSTTMYRERILPHHQRYLAAGDASSPRGMHLCGAATHLMPVMATELGIKNFDTGFPVDHGLLRQALGPAVEISGGPEVAILLDATPNRVYERTRAILQSGVMTGGRFILQEANNLPPCVPLVNLAALYAACQEFGRYE